MFKSNIFNIDNKKNVANYLAVNIIMLINHVCFINEVYTDYNKRIKRNNFIVLLVL